MAKEWSQLRKDAKKAMIEKGMTARELAEKINEATGRHYQVGHIAKVLDGDRWSACVMEHVCRFLDLPFPEGYWRKEGRHGEAEKGP